MRNKAVSLFTLFVYLIFSYSCLIYSGRREPIETVEDTNDARSEILAVMKKSGEVVNFSKKNPARFYNESIVSGYTMDINTSQVSSVTRKSGTVTEIKMDDGRIYSNPVVVSEEVGKIVIFVYEEGIRIPISEVEAVWIKRVDPGMSFLATIGAGIMTFGAIMIAAVLIKESCPFIYSFDGENYVFNAEPYGGAICKGLQRTEWCVLENLVRVRGQYKLLITNEVDETQYTDELILIVVDHPAGTKAIPDSSGKIHTVIDPLEPLMAYEAGGRNIMNYVSENDWIYWQTRIDEKDPNDTESLKDELIFEFPKPQGATEAKLIFNGCNSLWGSQMIKRSLELHGNRIDDWYQEIDSRGPAYFRLQTMGLREELYRLQIRVETAQGWKSKGLILGGGPFISEDRIYTIDLKDVPGDIVRIKLTPPACYWMINYLRIDYSDDLPVAVTEMAPLSVLDNQNQNRRSSLLANDGDYLVMPDTGDFAEAVFDAPTEIPGMERTVILKASGYYDIHLEAKGEPQTEILDRITNEPGFIVRFAIQEFQQWEKNSRNKIK